MQEFASDGSASSIYVRSDPDSVEAVRGVLAPTANPESPEEVEVSKPSDALSVRPGATSAFSFSPRPCSSPGSEGSQVLHWGRLRPRSIPRCRGGRSLCRSSRSAAAWVQHY
jgi:hypothetical protein